MARIVRPLSADRPVEHLLLVEGAAGRVDEEDVSCVVGHEVHVRPEGPDFKGFYFQDS